MQHIFLTVLVHSLLTSLTCVSDPSSKNLLHGHLDSLMVISPPHYTTLLCSGLRRTVTIAENLRHRDGKVVVQEMRSVLIPVPLIISRLIHGTLDHPFRLRDVLQEVGMIH